MATILVDGTAYEVEEGANLLHAVLSQQLDLPYFCWHPAMGSVGACRQCAVIQYMDEDDERGRLTMACMTPVTDGMRISIDTTHAKEFRKSVIEWLMENHPHDCPVCEEGGECHLQDMTVMTGHSVRRYESQKRTWENQNLGPFIGHEMNRCITCYRCVRFYQDYAGGKDLGAFGSRGRMYFGRVEDGTLESEFAGNLVEVCPTGVFTDKPFAKHYTRKWDLQSAPSICPGCSVGCNTIASERYGLLKRLHNRYHGEVNGYFLCDRGRFGSHFVNSNKRIRNAGVKADDGAFENRDEVVQQVATSLDDRTLAIGSPRASLESNFALKRLVGEANFCAGFSDVDQQLLATVLDVYRNGGFRLPTLTDIETADAVLILGEDISNTASRIALAVRQATRVESKEMAVGAGIPQWMDAGVRSHAQDRKSPLFIASVAATRLDELATGKCNGSAATIAEVGFAVSNAINTAFGKAHEIDFVGAAAAALQGAKNPLVITGCSLGNSAVLDAATDIVYALKANGAQASLVFVVPEVNSMGAAMLGGGLSMTDALQRMADGDNAIVIENDLYRRAGQGNVQKAVEGTGRLVVMDMLENTFVESGDIVLPAASYVEQTGTFVNYETRAQRFYQVFEAKDEIQPVWRWTSQIAAALDRSDACWNSFDDLSAACMAGAFEDTAQVAPDAKYRLDDEYRIPRQTHRYSGRTAMHAQISVHEPKATVDTETPFAYSMEGQNTGDQDGATIPYVWSPGWNSNQSVFKFQQEVGGPLNGGDPGLLLLDIPLDATDDVRSRYQAIPAAAQIDGKLHVEPNYLVFGSDELSNSSWPIHERSPSPFVLVNQADANRLGLEEGAGAATDFTVASVEVRIDEQVPPGVVCMSVGLAEIKYLDLTEVSLSHDANYVRPVKSSDRLIAKG